MMTRARRKKFLGVLLILSVSVLAFLAFYGKAYFSNGFRGMLGYELKDTLAQLFGYLRALDSNSTLLWEPEYFQFSPRLPQAPLLSPLTWVILGAHTVFNLGTGTRLLTVLLGVGALVQLAAVWTMYFFLRSRAFARSGSLLGALVYAFNHQTLVFGIRHGYERISAVALLPLAAWAVFRVLVAGDKTRRRGYVALAGLLLGLTFVLNSDLKPTAFFCIFFILAAIFHSPFRWRNLSGVALALLLALGIYLAQVLPTYYAYRVMNRGRETVAERLEYSLAPRDLVLTHVSTDFTPCPAYSWENTAEFSMTVLVAAFLGLLLVCRMEQKRIFLIGWAVALFWIMGRHTPLGHPLGWLMSHTGLTRPARMSVLVYFIYSVLAAHGLTCLRDRVYVGKRILLLLAIPALVFLLRILGPVEFSWRAVWCPLASGILIILISRGQLRPGFLWVIPGLFLVEQTPLLSSLEEANRADPTRYYAYSEIFQPQPREKDLLRRRDVSNFRTFFASRDRPDLFSHNYYLPGMVRMGQVHPLWAFFCLDEEFVRVAEVKGAMLEDWSNPFWDILRVKYIVDLDRYFGDWDEEDVSRRGLEHLRRVGENLWLNPGCEPTSVFFRGRTEVMPREEFVRKLREGDLDLGSTAYLEPEYAGFSLPSAAPSTARITVTDSRPGEVTVWAEAVSPGIAILSDYWFFPWKARLDGEEIEAFPVNNALIGAALPPGRHQVQFYFDSWHPAFLFPIIFSGLLALALVFYSWSQLRGADRAANPIPAARPGGKMGLR